MQRKILHLDLDAFFCSVEELQDPSLVGKPFAVGGNPQGRGVVASCSYAARRCGVHSAMPASRARQLCPGLIFVHHRHALYEDYSKRVMDILYDSSPLVEQISVDEAFLDLSDLNLPLESIARELQARVLRETGLPCSIGGASNRMVAKVANNIGKSSVKSGKAPQKITIIPFGKEKAFLAPLDVQELWGIGPKTAERLHSRAVYTIGAIAELNSDALKALFGNQAHQVQQLANGIDPTPLTSSREAKSLSNEVTFNKDIVDYEQLSCQLRQLADQVARRLRREELIAGLVYIKLRYSDFSTLTRQQILADPGALEDDIYFGAKKLLDETLIPGRAVRLLGLGVSKLSPPAYQLSLWSSEKTKKQKLASAIDVLKDKFGKDILKRARDLD